MNHHRQLARLVMFGIAFAFIVSSVAQPAPTQARQRRMVYAYYFGWHTGVSWQNNTLIDQPLARYDSRETWAIERHIALAQSAGIDAFVMSWFGEKDNNITGAAFNILLDKAAQHGFYAAASVDLAQDNFNSTIPDVETSLHVLLDSKVQQPAYLRYNGKPLIYFWNQGHFTVPQWQSIREHTDPHHKAIWVMEGADTSYMAVFDGLYLFNTAWSHDNGGTSTGWAGRVFGGGGVFYTPTVMPGWDESRLPGRSHPTPPQDRANGAFLYNSWAGATEAGTPSILIVSWNEFQENSYIEPSVRYGTQALDILRPLIAAWKTGKAVPVMHFAPTVTATPSGSRPATQAAAQNANQVTGKSLTANTLIIVRADPKVASVRLGTIDAGKVYPIEAQNGDWYQIPFNGAHGWVNSAYVTVK
ncbi:MAG TPA: endo-1,3-alpha-glucanase family glycosylhydrolase [Aggregatilineales bacterium]|nr:endo-1,3-alpha-glucanase family glycosylhydrolase [Aggregatilineales bacterium]